MGQIIRTTNPNVEHAVTSPAEQKMSAYMGLEYSFNYDKAQLPPPGKKIIIHKNPAKRKSWDAHRVYGWYLSPAMEYYRCWRVWSVDIRA